MLDEALAAGHEGVVVKDADSPYAAGRRGQDVAEGEAGADVRSRRARRRVGPRPAAGTALEPAPRRARSRRRLRDGREVLQGPDRRAARVADARAARARAGAARDRRARAARARGRDRARRRAGLDALPGRRGAPVRAREALPARQGRVRGGHDRLPAGAAPPTSGWLEPSELRVGLGCMRLSRIPRRSRRRSRPGSRCSTPRAPTSGNEALLGRALRGGDRPRRHEGRDGRRLDPGRTGAGDPRRLRGEPRGARRAADRPLPAARARSAHAAGDLGPGAGAPGATRGSSRRVGVANVNLAQLEEALAYAPVAAVQVALGPLDDRALRERPRRALRGARDHGDGALAARRAEARCPPASRGAGGGRARVDARAVAGRGRDPGCAPARRRRAPSARAARRRARPGRARAARRRLFGRSAATTRAGGSIDSDLVLVVGIPGAGKSRLAEGYVAPRLRAAQPRRARRDRCGSSRARSTSSSRAGERRVVLDNTYLTRASRSYAVDAAARHGLALRCVWLDTPLAQAQVNLVERLLDRFGELPPPEELRRLSRARARRDGADVADARAARARGALDGRRASSLVERVAFERAPWAARSVGVFVAAAAVGVPGWDAETPPDDVPHLVFDWGDGTELGRAGGPPPGATSAGPSRRCSARTAAGRPSAGAARRFRACRSSSPAPTGSIPRARLSSASPERTRRSPRRSARAMSALSPR